MAYILIPIALSSQLDVTGEERIHAAGYAPVVRPAWVVVPQPMFVAVGDGGKIATSVDGQEWVLRTSGTVSNIGGVGYGAGKFFASAQTGSPRSVLVTSNGADWAAHSLPIGTTGGGKCSYGAGKYMVGNMRQEVYLSDDAETWEIVVPAAGTSSTSAVGGTDTHLLLGDTSNTVLYSTDAVAFTSGSAGVGAGADINDFIYDGTNYIIAASSGSGSFPNVRSSTDLSSWTTRLSATYGTWAITHGEGVYVTATNGARIYRSVGLSAWGLVTNPFTFFINDVQYGGGVMVACADGGELAYSTDLGATWNLATHPFGSSNIKSLAYGVL